MYEMPGLFLLAKKAGLSSLMYVILGGTLTLPSELVPVLFFCRAVKATSQVHLVSALPFGFLRLVGMVRSKFLLAGLHGS